jgi:hypothetical protein
MFMQLSPQLQALEHVKDRRTQVHLRVPHERSAEQPQYASCTQDAETGSSVVSVGFRMPSSKFHPFSSGLGRTGHGSEAFFHMNVCRCARLMWRKSVF